MFVDAGGNKLYPVDIKRFTSAIMFAAEKHKLQRRKDAARAPYVNHLIDVVNIMACCEVTNEDTLIAAVLHDVMEDANVSVEELDRRFGFCVSRIVRELSQDKSLDRETRKALEIEHAASLSPASKMIKIADKISNIRNMVESPPEGWDNARVSAYLYHAQQVVLRCRGIATGLDDAFDRALAHEHHLIDDGE